MRDVLIHEYFRVDLSAVWEVTQDEVPVLLARVRELILDATEAMMTTIRDDHPAAEVLDPPYRRASGDE